MKIAGKVTGLNIFPVKSCRGISLTEMTINEKGPLHDRQWMLVDESNQFMTLRTFARMAEIQTAIQGPFLHLYAGSNKILVKIDEECELTENVRVWGDTVLAGIENKSVNEALSDFLQKTVKLARYQSQSYRPLDEAGTVLADQMMFADSRPLLLTNENSLKDLNQKLTAQGLAPSLMERYRANIVVSGLDSYAEDEISDCKVGEVVLQNPHLCGRCPIITQDVATGKVVSKETLTALAAYRKRENSRSIPFGVHFTPAKAGVIKIGDAITADL